ncbi:MAG: hypothetical protein KJZ92_14100 [Rhodocyclaceae bacterium]|nr:hypothetical protein [Rhodocyclaceae bacterium]
MVTQQRAQDILRNQGPFGRLDLTPEEDVFIRRVWASMPGWTCYYDAVTRIAKGEALGELPRSMRLHGHEVVTHLTDEGIKVYIDDRYEALCQTEEAALGFARKACSGEIRKSSLVPVEASPC